jgi:glycosyltransferase involved in cell wall biosynthesis
MPSGIRQHLFRKMPMLSKMERRQYFDLGYYIKKRKVDCVIAEYGTVGADVWPTCKRFGIPVIVYFRGLDISVHKILKDYQSEYRKMFSYVSSIIVVSRHMIPTLEAMGASANQIYYNPSYPDNQFFELTPAIASFSFISIGRLVEKKGTLLTLLAFSKVLTDAPEARLLIIGDGPLKQQCEWVIKGMNMAHAVEMKGTQSHEIVRQLMNESFCLVQHSITATDGNSEGTPGVILEAGAAGLPVVATRHAGVPDVVMDGETGFLVEEGDVKAMANAMLTLYRDRTLCTQMGTAARKRIKENFSAEKHLALMHKLIESAVAGN